MSWTLDAVNTGVTESDANGIVTFSHTMGSVENGILFVWAAWETATTTIGSVTYGGVAMTQVVHQATNRATDIWYLLSPPSGAASVVINATSGIFGRICAGSHSWSGATSGPAATQSANGNSTTPTLSITATIYDLIVDCVGVAFVGGDTLTVGADQTQRGQSAGTATIGSSSTQLGSAGGAMTWTDSASRAWGYVAAAFTGFSAVYPYIPVKLPNNIVNIPMPALQANSATTTGFGIRITEQINNRVTRGGNTRVTRDYTITSKPELIVLKLDNGVITIPVRGPKPTPEGAKGKRKW